MKSFDRYNRKLNIVILGKTEYKEALDLQERIFELRQQGKISDTLLLLEHPSVITLGKRGVYSNIIVPKEELAEKGISIYEVSRGGDVTYHGPGQIVGYPIVNLKEMNKGVKDFVWGVEEVFIQLLKNEFKITACRDTEKYTGVWVDNEKITAIGIAVKHWITMHGFAFNVNTELEYFRLINPCGITDRGVTSLEKLLGRPQDLNNLIEMVLTYFCGIFRLQPEIVEKKALLESLEG
jgi:lipoate-protein ligase B